MAKKITLKELAAMTGTSVSTVSKALNQSTEISESTRRRIVEVARASHYQFGKQSLPEERQKIVGFLVPDVSNPYFARLWRGVEDTLIIVTHTDYYTIDNSTAFIFNSVD